jgi:L-ascorbate metabolism protein UlaG (beta-lactamase superfamily)
VWLSGDTVLYDGVREVAQRLDVDLAVLHLGAVQFPITGPLRYSMNGREAAELIGLLRPRAAVPVHFEGWSHFRQQESALHQALEAAPDDVRRRLRWLTRGKPLEI